MNLNLNDYLDLNREGIFPGPEESEEEFHQRVHKLRTAIALPAIPLTQQDWSATHCVTQRLFDIQPTWIPAFYRNKKLSFWEAAAAWDCEGRAVVQLRTQLSRGRFLFVDKQEVLAHEAAHAARMAFRESHFEEIICYQTSRLSWRRRIGPLFRHPWEALLCVGGAAIGWLFGVLGMFSLSLIIPWVPFVFFLLRLLRDRHLFKRCLAHISPLLAQRDQVLAVALRLTDREILFFARASEEAIVTYIQQQCNQQLRWRVIASAYFKRVFCG